MKTIAADSQFAPAAKVICLAAALFLSFAGNGAFAQTEPVKPQLPSTPTPPNAQPPAPRVVVSPEVEDSVNIANKPPEPEKSKNRKPEKEAKEGIPFKDRITYGGNFGLQFGDYTFIDVSPVVGYKLSEVLLVGPGVVYNHISVKGIGKYNLYGGKVFGRAALFNLIDHPTFSNVFVHSEYEVLNIPRLTLDPVTYEIDETRLNIGTWLAGLGNRFMLGDYSSIDALLLVNLTPSLYSPYASPLIIKFGFTGGW